MENINKIISDILAMFHQQSINYCILRNYDGFDFTRNKDLDLLIDESQEKEIQLIFDEVFQGYKIPLKSKNGIRVKKYYFILPTKRSFTFDLHKYITIKTNKFEKQIPFLGTKVKIDNFQKKNSENPEDFVYRILDERAESLLLTNHCLSKPKEEYFKKLKNNLMKLNYPLNSLEEVELYKISAFLMRLNSIKRQNLFSQVFQLPIYLLRYYFYKHD